MAKSTACHQGISALMSRLMNESGDRTITTTIATIRSVATGVLGVAVIQSLLSGIGLLIADIPGAGIWAIAVLILAIAQLPPILVLGPIAAYYFSIADTTPAIAFLIFSIIVSMSDAVLKPIFLGRGMDIPMLVILLGAIGGMLLSGIIGLFVGAVALALGYQLMMDWLAHSPTDHT
jgi:predicted PurR-regulated permease PerM